MIVFRGVIISLATFALLYVGLSSALAGLCRLLPLERLRGSMRLYVLRAGPLCIASLAVGVLTLPSFVYLEPHSPEEGIGWFAWTMAAVGGIVVMTGLARGLGAVLQAWQFQKLILSRSDRWVTPAALPVRTFPYTEPVMLVTGLWRPTVLVSSRALDLLDHDELNAAVEHELAHAAHRDNRKKLLLRSCPFPFLRSLEQRWHEEMEMAADDSAARDDATALDLASALLKMTRCVSSLAAPELSLRLVSGPGAVLDARIQRLLSGQRPSRHAGRPLWPALVLAVALLAANYGWLLLRAHELSELLIR